MRGIFAKLGAAALLVALAFGAAFGLDVDQTRNTVARLNSTQQVNYYRVTINWNDPRISTAQKFGRLPSNAFINRVSCHVTTVFNGTTNTVMLGTSLANSNEIIDAVSANKSINEASATFQDMTSSNALGVGVTSAGETDLYAKYTSTGSTPSAGSVTCTILYTPNNDM